MVGNSALRVVVSADTFASVSGTDQRFTHARFLSLNFGDLGSVNT